MLRGFLERLFLVLLVGAVGALAYHAATRHIDTSALAAPAGDGAAPEQEPRDDSRQLPEPPRLADLTETLKRPLFRPDRRPWRPEPEKVVAAPAPRVEKKAAEPPVPPPQNVRLVGIIERQDGSRTAMIRAEGEREGLTLGRGGALAGWTIMAIEADRVVLGSGTRRHHLTLDQAPPSAPGDRTRRN